jgi:hypothetical protein
MYVPFNLYVVLVHLFKVNIVYIYNLGILLSDKR